MIGIGPDALRLDGQVALVTGASKNIGAAIAASFARAGADVLMVARGEELLQATAERVRAAAPERRIEITTADVRDAEVLAAHALEAFGRVDTLVNNALDAGLDDGLNVLDVPDATWERVFAVNLFAPLRLIRALAPTLGNVINVVSGSGLLPNSAPGHLPAPTMAPYGVSKGALWTLTRYLAAELAPRIRVNALCPGLTSENGGMRSEEPYERLLRAGAVPMGRIARPEEVAGAAVYLASPAASYTTGEILVANGGRAFYQGQADPLVPQVQILEYYNALRDELGGQRRADEVARLFLINGMGHCGGGLTPETSDLTLQIVRWVEDGLAPDSITVRDPQQGRTRPVFSYPRVPKFVGPDPNTPESFVAAPSPFDHDDDVDWLGDFLLHQH